MAYIGLCVVLASIVRCEDHVLHVAPGVTLSVAHTVVRT